MPWQEIVSPIRCSVSGHERRTARWGGGGTEHKGSLGPWGCWQHVPTALHRDRISPSHRRAACPPSTAGSGARPRLYPPQRPLCHGAVPSPPLAPAWSGCPTPRAARGDARRIRLLQPRGCPEERVSAEGGQVRGHVSGSNRVLQEVGFGQKEDPWCAPEPGPSSPPPRSGAKRARTETAVPLGQAPSSPTSRRAPLQGGDGRDGPPVPHRRSPTYLEHPTGSLASTSQHGL